MKSLFFSFVATVLASVFSVSASASPVSVGEDADETEETAEVNSGGVVEGDESSAVSEKEDAMDNVELAKKIAGSYMVSHGGVSYDNKYFELQPVQKVYRIDIEVDGDGLLFRNFNDYGMCCSFRGVVDGDAHKIRIESQDFYREWSRFNLSGKEESVLFAMIGEDCSTITFEPYRVLLDGVEYENVESLVLTKLPEAVEEWCVTGTAKWTTENGRPSGYIKRNSEVSLTKFVQGDEVYYELSGLSGGGEVPVPMMFSVTRDDALQLLDATDDRYYEGVGKHGDFVAFYPYNADGTPASAVEGDAEGGICRVPYYYYLSNSDGEVAESGVFRFLWGTRNVPDANFTTVPAAGSTVEGFNSIVYTFTGAQVADFNVAVPNVSIVDENGYNVGGNVSTVCSAENNQIVVSCEDIEVSGIYTITIGKGSLVLDDLVVNQDLVVTIIVNAPWKGKILLPESAATVEDLLNVPVVFPDADEVTVSGMGVLGAVFDADGSIYALLFADAEHSFAGGLDSDGDHVTAHFMRMSDMSANDSDEAAACIRRIGGFAQPERGFATLFFCPKSFVIDGNLYGKAIRKTYEVAGSGMVTGVEAVSVGDASVYYDLQGRRVAAPQRGVFVRNGEKIVR